MTNKPDFSIRSTEKEILDDQDSDIPGLERNLKELRWVNNLLGGYSSILKGVKQVISNKYQNSDTIRITDVGCGGGDILKMLAQRPEFSEFDLKLTGFDANSSVLEYARRKTSGIDFRVIDILSGEFKIIQSDIFTFNLCTHHFTDEELAEIIGHCHKNGAGIVISDLRRSELAYHLFRIFSSVLGFSRTGKHDGKLSILRGFKQREWRDIFKMAGIKQYRIQNHWAFRHLIIVS